MYWFLFLKTKSVFINVIWQLRLFRQVKQRNCVFCFQSFSCMQEYGTLISYLLAYIIRPMSFCIHARIWWNNEIKKNSNKILKFCGMRFVFILLWFMPLLRLSWLSFFFICLIFIRFWLWRNYTERQKKLITSSECHSLKSKASTWIIFGHRLGKSILNKHI